jgi:hypothetical protein
LQDEAHPGQFCSPEDPIRDCDGRTLPSIVYPFTEGGSSRRARSFGQLTVESIEQEFAKTTLDGSSDTALQSDGESPTSLPSSDSQNGSSPSTLNASSLAEKVLCKEWDRRDEQGLFRYDVKSCSTKVRGPGSTLEHLIALHDTSSTTRPAITTVVSLLTMRGRSDLS